MCEPVYVFVKSDFPYKNKEKKSPVPVELLGFVKKPHLKSMEKTQFLCVIFLEIMQCNSPTNAGFILIYLS